MRAGDLLDAQVRGDERRKSLRRPSVDQEVERLVRVVGQFLRTEIVEDGVAGSRGAPEQPHLFVLRGELERVDVTVILDVSRSRDELRRRAGDETGSEL